MVERLTKRDERGEVYVVVSDDRIETVIRSLKVTLERLAAYEDTGLEPEEIERIHDEYGRGMTLRTSNAERLAIIKEVSTDRLREIFQKQDPLSLDELQEMIGNPLWVVPLGKEPDWNPCWVICEEDYIFVPSEVNESRVYLLRPNKDYGKTWLAYRRKPGNQNDQNT